MNVNGKVISVEIDVEVAKKSGGFYPGSRLTYRTDAGQVQEQAFHSNAFKFNAPLKVSLANLSAGDDIVIEKEKDGDFWKVLSITKKAGGDTTIMTSKASATTSASPSPKSTYATAEERAQIQVYIIRQSSLSSAVALASTLKLKNEDEVMRIAKKFEGFVMGESEFGEEEKLDYFDMENDIPL